MAARSVRCRAGCSRAPPVRNANRLFSRARISSTGSIRLRAAANSIASGSPSNLAHNCATMRAFCSDRRNSGETACVRCTYSATDGTSASSVARAGRRMSGTASGATGKMRSQLTWSGSRLVSSIFSCGELTRSRVSMTPAARTCSKLSRTSSTCLPARNTMTCASSACPTSSAMLSDRVMACRTSSGSRTG
jgi:hypothetical protein